MTTNIQSFIREPSTEALKKNIYLYLVQPYK